MSERSPTAITTRSGRVVDFVDPAPDAITLDDVASGLSLAPRFGGQALEFRSVAEHATGTARLVTAMGFPELALPALHHDSHEAFACDIPRPLKLLLEPAYGEITSKLDRAIATALGFPHVDLGSEAGRPIRQADDAMFVVEAERSLPGVVYRPDVPEPVIALAREIVNDRPPLPADQAREEFLAVHATHSR